MPTDPYISQIIPAPGFNDALDETRNTVILAQDGVIYNSIDILAVAGFSLPLYNGAWYAFKAQFIYEASTTNELYFGFTKPENTYTGIFYWTPGASPSTTTNNIDLNGGMPVGGLGAGIPVTMRMAGYVVPQGYGGDLSITLQTLVEASNAIVKRGSWMSTIRVL